MVYNSLQFFSFDENNVFFKDLGTCIFIVRVLGSYL